MDGADSDLLSQAIAGDGRAFESLLEPHLPQLRGLLRRLLVSPADADDALQETLLQVQKALPSFERRSKLSTWLYTIALRTGRGQLSKQATERWRPDAIEYWREACEGDQSLAGELGAELMNPDLEFDAQEHIAFCFSCVARSLPFDQQAALLLRDVFELTNEEAAGVVGTSHSVLRHALSGARSTMQTHYEGLCSLVSKQGICYQCQGLREFVPEERRGTPVPELASADADERFKRRLRVVREAPRAAPGMRQFQELIAAHLKAIEARRPTEADVERLTRDASGCKPGDA